MSEGVEFFAGAPSRGAIAAFRLSPLAQERIHAVLARNAAGTLSPAEERELDQKRAVHTGTTKRPSSLLAKVAGFSMRHFIMVWGLHDGNVIYPACCFHSRGRNAV